MRSDGKQKGKDVAEQNRKRFFLRGVEVESPHRVHIFPGALDPLAMMYVTTSTIQPAEPSYIALDFN
jgi:hypothetical protein